MERIRAHLSFANVAAALALVFSMTGGAIAATGGFSGGGTLRACANEEGTLKLLKAGKHCKKGQKAVSWSQTGPTGAKGAAGAPGAGGPAGANGAAGSPGASAVNLWARVAADGTLQAGSGVVAVTGTDPYEVQFNREITKCGATATVNSGAFAVAFANTILGASPRNVLVVLATEGSISPRDFTVTVPC
jgi:hypothetical protein